MSKGKSLRKYSFEEKEEVIIDGEKNELSNHELSRKYSMPLATVRGWRKAYKEKGIEGLRSMNRIGRTNNRYTSEFRIAAVKEKLEENKSYNELGEKYNINKNVIQMWVRKYLEKGEEGLKERERIKAPKSNYKKTKIPENKKKDINKEIYTELEYLRAEVAYLKKFNALAWEKEQSKKKKKLK